MPTGFLVGPVKLPGPQPIYIVNEASTPQAFTLQPVATSSVSSGGRTFCLPTSVPVPWFHTAQEVVVPAGKTVYVPVHVTGIHQGVDVAIAVRPVSGPGTGVAVSYTSFAQEIIGGTTASGCAHIRGLSATMHSSPLPVAPIAGGSGALVIAAVAAVLYRRRRPSRTLGTHRKSWKGSHS